MDGAEGIQVAFVEVEAVGLVSLLNGSRKS